ncbi:hypothetical protein MnTg02_00363 [bacterium MnTg02]|nr:hypothetical protein MnTg02_00363 [bacterium MnTg02]
MTAQQFLSVAMRIVGIYVFFQFLIGIPTLIYSIILTPAVGTVATGLGFLVLWFGGALLLIFKSDLLASWLVSFDLKDGDTGSTHEDVRTTHWTVDQATTMAFTVLGVYFLATAIVRLPYVVRFTGIVTGGFKVGAETTMIIDYQAAIGLLIQIAISLLLIFGATGLKRLLNFARMAGPKEAGE